MKVFSAEKEIHEKRNKGKFLSYSLIPLAAEGAARESVMADALRRYEFIQKFLQESKSFGAQRRESEAKVCAIAQDNLARNAGFSDALRFAWRMETFKIEEVKSFFKKSGKTAAAAGYGWKSPKTGARPWPAKKTMAAARSSALLRFPPP
jgi:hypothetical protein